MTDETPSQLTETRERLAELCHAQWSGWMEYLFSKCVNPIEPNTGTVVIPKWAVERWRRQIATPYADLAEEEKDSDRKEADRILAVLPTPSNDLNWKALALVQRDLMECDKRVAKFSAEVMTNIPVEREIEQVRDLSDAISILQKAQAEAPHPAGKAGSENG